MIEASVNPVAKKTSILSRVCKPGLRCIMFLTGKKCDQSSTEYNRFGQNTSVVISSSTRNKVEARHNHCDCALLLLDAA
jgi:hypothetical protein